VVLGKVIWDYKKAVLTGIMSLIFIITAVTADARFLENSRGCITASIPAIEQKKYLLTVTFQPQLYWQYDKLAPDRYFQPFFLSSFFNVQAKKDQVKHREYMKDKYKDTAFTVVREIDPGEEVAVEFFDNFGDDFGLKKQGVYDWCGSEMEVYWGTL
jgi:hypothetical protein